jgi:hypothetical protein
MLKVDVTASRELRAMIQGLALIGPEFSKLFRTEARKAIEPEWQRALEQSRPNRLQRHVLVSTSKVSVTDRAIRLRAGATGKLSSGDSNAEIARATEFGQSPQFRSRYRRRNDNGGTHTVVRRTAIPVGPRKKTGKVVYPALERFVPRAAAIAVDTFVSIIERITNRG